MISVPRLNNGQLFCLLAAVNLLLVWLAREHFCRPEILYHLFGEQIEMSRLQRQMDILQNWFTLDYVLLPAVLLVKFAFLSFVFQLPLLFLTEEVLYGKIFRMIMIASWVMIAGSLLQVALLMTQPLEAVSAGSLGIMPLSLGQILAAGHTWSVSAMAVWSRFSLFELLWCMIIYYRLKGITLLRNGPIAHLVTAVWVFLLFLQWLLTEMLALLTI
jgi:hypothetical protein